MTVRDLIAAAEMARPASRGVDAATSASASGASRFSALAPRNISFAAASHHVPNPRAIPATPSGSVDAVPHTPSSLAAVPLRRNLSLETLGLPPDVARYYRDAKRIERLYPWQAECLSLEGVFDHRANLVYCAPTSGGKSLVSDVLMVRRLSRRPGSLGLAILPFVSLCDERADDLDAMLRSTGLEVRRLYGGRGGKLPPADGPGGLLVCTPEKANDVVTKLVEEERVGELAVVVVDELHMVQDPGRGGTLELALTKLMFASAKRAAGSGWNASPAASDATAHDHLVPLTGVTGLSTETDEGAFGPQIIGMSATMPNVDGLARWLGGARLYETDFRPVPLSISIKKGVGVYALPTPGLGDDEPDLAPTLSESRKTRTLRAGSDAEHVLELVRETFERGAEAGGVIVFCAAKFQCETTANALARGLAGAEEKRDDDAAKARDALVEELRRLAPNNKDTDRQLCLATCATRGVAWHHSALHVEEKAAIERGFREGALRVVCCTSTMATGVNLPASRVVISTAYTYRKRPALHELARARDLQQMVGRAGRAGFSARGEAFVVCPKSNEVSWSWAPDGRRGDMDALARELAARLTSQGDALSSTIAEDGMRRVMLEAVSCGLAQGPADIKRYIECTLLNALNDFQDVVAKGATTALSWLERRGFIRWDVGLMRWEPSPLGRAAAAAHLEPAAAVAVVEDVRRARQCLILESDLHLLFLCVPPDPIAAADADPSAAAPPAPTPTPPTNKPPVADDECWLNESVFLNVYRKLSAHEQNVAAAVGITEAYYGRLERRRKDQTPEHRALRRVCHRFLKALQLHDVISERDAEETAAAFGVRFGHLSRLQEDAARYAGQVASVCGPMGWGDVETLVTRLQDRITAGAREEILCLTSIPMIGASRARVLYNAGYRTPEAIVNLPARKLATLLESRRGARGGEMRAAKAILRGAKVLCEEQRRAAREESEAKLRQLKRLAPIDEETREEEETKDGEDVVAAGGSFDPSRARGATVIREPDALEAFARHWRAATEYAFALHPGTRAAPRGHGPAASPPEGIAVAFPSNPLATFFIPVVVDGGDAASRDSRRRGFRWETVRAILATPGPRKVTIDLKPQLRAMGAADGTLAGVVAAPVVDVRVAAWILRPEAPTLACGSSGAWHKTEDIARTFKGDLDEKAIREAARWKLGGLATNRAHAAAAGSALAAAVALAADVAFRARAASESPGIVSALEETEMPLVPVLASMEACGMPFAPETLRRQLRQANRRRAEIETLFADATVKACAGATASIASSADVSRVLFEHLKLPVPPCAVVTGADGRGRRRFKTNAEVLRALAGQNPLPALVLEHRTLSKCASAAEEMIELARKSGATDVGDGDGADRGATRAPTDARAGAAADVIAAIAASRDPDAPDDGATVVRLRGSIHQTNVETGRLAMEEPNLQTVPKTRDFVLALAYGPRDSAEGARGVSPGTAPGAEETISVRAAFRAPRGRVLVSFDYKQLELRIMAHLSDDCGLVVAFVERPDSDPFRVLAARWLGADERDVRPFDRARAKALAYATLYGSGPARFAAETGSTESEAKIAMDAFRESVPGVEAWRARVVREAAAREPPAVFTLGGRRRLLPGLAGAGPERAADERRAVNTACQGSAADVVKRAMIDVHARLDGEKKTNTLGPDEGEPSEDESTWAALRAGECRMVLQVHDELLFEVNEIVAADAVRAIRRVMERAGAGLRVPLPVRVSVGYNWAELEEVHY